MTIHLRLRSMVVLIFASTIFQLLAVSTAISQQIGYDENTEIVVKGIVQKEAAHPYRGLANFFLKTQWKIFRVLTAPGWYMREASVKLKKGQQVEVIGSKFYGLDGSLCLVAKTIRILPQGKIIRFRDSLARPIWTEMNKKNSCMKIFLPQGKAF